MKLNETTGLPVIQEPRYFKNPNTKEENPDGNENTFICKETAWWNIIYR